MKEDFEIILEIVSSKYDFIFVKLAKFMSHTNCCKFGNNLKNDVF